MTDYVAPVAGETDPDKPIRSEFGSKALLNPLAMFEGAAGAPRLQQEAVDSWFTTFDGTKTYAIGIPNTELDTGDLIAGVNIRVDADIVTPKTLTGTWRCMGKHKFLGTDPDSDIVYLFVKRL